MDIAISGNFNTSNLHEKNVKIHKVIRPGYKLYVGTECNDGRPITESRKYKQALKIGIPIIRNKPVIAPLKNEKPKEIFVNKYAPKNVIDIIGHKDAVSQLTNWLSSWNSNLPEKRGVIITGPPGIGKTTTVHLVAIAAGYKVTEYNASDSRSVSTLRSLIALGIRRLIKEVIIMDEIDGVSERGGIGELANIISKTQIPIICIANEKPPKLRPIINVCLDIKFNRPNKSTIANAMLKIATAEKIQISKVELEELCESNGNDIRSILNNLEFYKEDVYEAKNNKDANLRMDIFSATSRLIGNKRIGLEEASGLIFIDYNMIPLMVQEAYLASSKGGLEEAVRASNHISVADIIDRRIHQNHDWSLLPHYVTQVVSATRAISGPPPFQIFPAWLGKNSKKLKHRRYLDNLSNKMFCSNDSMRMDYAEPLNKIILQGLIIEKPDIKNTIEKMDLLGFTRDDIMEQLQEVLFETIEIPTKIKTTFTREYNKTHLSGMKKSKTTKKRKVEEMSDEEDDEEDEDGDELQDENEIDIMEI